MDFLFEIQHLAGEECTCLLQSFCVNHHTSFLHLSQDRHQRHFDFCKEAPESFLFEFFFKENTQLVHIITIIYGEQVIQMVPHFWVQEVVGNLCVEHRMVCQTLRLEFFPLSFQIVANNSLLPTSLNGRGDYNEWFCLLFFLRRKGLALH